MTTIATKDGFMCSDGRMSLGATIIKDDTIKVFNINNHLVGVCGAARAISTFVSWLQKHTDYRMVSEQVGDLVDLIPPVLEQSEDYTALVVTPDKQVLLYDNGVPIDMGNDVHMAIGSGGDFALSAMDSGLSAEEAVKVAMKRDVYSGGTITVVSLEEEPEMIDKESAMKMSKEELICKLFPEDEADSAESEEELVYFESESGNLTINKDSEGIWIGYCEEAVSLEQFIAGLKDNTTRADLVWCCEELGIKYPSNIGNDKLIKKVVDFIYDQIPKSKQ